MSTNDKKITELDGRSIHPAALLFPAPKPKDFKQLADDIKANSLREPIKLFNGQILDGVNRVRACIEAGVMPRYDELPPYTNPWRFALSANIHRRHLKPGQRIALVKKALAKEVQAAKAADLERKRSGKKSNLGSDGTKVPTADEIVAKEADVSVSAVKKHNVVEQKSPKLAKQVAKGKKSLGKAHSQVKKAGKPKPKKSEKEILADVQRQYDEQIAAKERKQQESDDGEADEPIRTTAPTQRVRSWLSSVNRCLSETTALVGLAEDSEFSDEEQEVVDRAGAMLVEALEVLRQQGVAS